MTVVSSVCRGCGAKVDPVRALPFRCPEARDGDGIDHVLLPSASNVPAAAFPIDRNSANPFVRYRALFLSHRAALTSGLTDAGYVEIVESLDAAVTGVDGRGFRVTPLTAYPEGHPGSGALWIKNDTGNVAGSHKARHVFGVMVYLRVIEALRLSIAEGLRGRPLAIASCGNAALAAAVVARASDWPIDVFIPDDAEAMVVAQLRELGARLHVQTRAEGVVGDPCVHAFRAAVEAGAIPFGVQGNENGLAIEGGQTLGYELAEAFAAQSIAPDDLYIQVGGGALGSGTYRGLSQARDLGLVAALPAIHAVQTRGAFPLQRAFERFVADHGPDFDADAMVEAAHHRGRYMWPWEDTPHSVAHGILDDETYDWHVLIEAMIRTGGRPVIAEEATLVEAHRVANRILGFRASHTGSSGFAGFLEAQHTRRYENRSAVVLMTGVETSSG